MVYRVRLESGRAARLQGFESSTYRQIEDNHMRCPRCGGESKRVSPFDPKWEFGDRRCLNWECNYQAPWEEFARIAFEIRPPFEISIVDDSEYEDKDAESSSG